MTILDDTTRRYPRTLAEAFPDERAHCIEHYKASIADQIVGWFCAVGTVVLIGLICAGNL